MREMQADSEAIAEAVKAGVGHRREVAFAVQRVDGQIQAISFGTVILSIDISRSDCHEIFAAFTKAWCDAGQEKADDRIND